MKNAEFCLERWEFLTIPYSVSFSSILQFPLQSILHRILPNQTDNNSSFYGLFLLFCKRMKWKEFNRWILVWFCVFKWKSTIQKILFFRALNNCEFMFLSTNGFTNFFLVWFLNFFRNLPTTASLSAFAVLKRHDTDSSGEDDCGMKEGWTVK